MCYSSTMGNLLTLSEAANVLGMHRDTVARKVRDGEIRGINLAQEGKRPVWRIAGLDLAEHVARRRAGSAT